MHYRIENVTAREKTTDIAFTVAFDDYPNPPGVRYRLWGSAARVNADFYSFASHPSGTDIKPGDAVVVSLPNSFWFKWSEQFRVGDQIMLLLESCVCATHPVKGGGCPYDEISGGDTDCSCCQSCRRNCANEV